MLCDSWLYEYQPLGGQCPNDWEQYQLSQIADFYGGYSYKGNELCNSATAMATIKNFDRNGGFKFDGYKEIKPSDKLKVEHQAELFDILVAHTDLTQNAEVIGNAEMVTSTNGYERIIYSMDLVKVLPKRNSPLSRFLLAAILQNARFKSHCLGYVNGTTVLHLSKKALPEYKLFLPTNLSILKPLDNALGCLYRKIVQISAENLQLKSLRDALLPKLMSGEIDVSDVEI